MVVKSARVVRSLGKDVLLVSKLGEPFQFATAGPVLAIQIAHFGYDFSEIHSQFILDAAGSRKDFEVMYRAAARTVSRSNIAGLAGLGALGLGSAIYILFRPRSLLMFSWFDWMGLGAVIDSLRSEWHGFAEHLPAALLGSAPFALWVLAYMLLIEAIWAGERTVRKAMWKWTVPLAAVCAEVGQIGTLVPGTFDYLDLLAISLAILAGIFFPVGLRLQNVNTSFTRRRNVVSACILLVTAILIAGCQQQAKRRDPTDMLVPPPPDAAAQGQASLGSGSSLQQAEDSHSGQGQSQGSTQGQGTSCQPQNSGQSAQGALSSQDQGSGGSGDDAGDTQDPQGSTGAANGDSLSSKGQDARSQQGTLPGQGQSDQAGGVPAGTASPSSKDPLPDNEPGGMQAGQSTDINPLQQQLQEPQILPQQGGHHAGSTQPQSIAPAGSDSGPGGSSPFATNAASPGVPRLDPVTGGYVVTPANPQTPAAADPQRVPQQTPDMFPEYR